MIEGIIFIALIVVIFKLLKKAYKNFKEYNSTDNKKAREEIRRQDEAEPRIQSQINHYRNTPELRMCSEMVFEYCMNIIENSPIDTSREFIDLRYIRVTERKMYHYKGEDSDDGEYGITILMDFNENDFCLENPLAFAKALRDSVDDKFRQAHISTDISDFKIRYNQLTYQGGFAIKARNPNYIPPKQYRKI